MPEAFLYCEVDKQEVQQGIADVIQKQQQKKQHGQDGAGSGELPGIVENADRRPAVETAVGEEIEQPHAEVQHGSLRRGEHRTEQIHGRSRKADAQHPEL